MISGETVGSGRGIVHRMVRLIPLQSLKIIIVAWQIVTQVGRANQRLVLGERFFSPMLCSLASKYCTSLTQEHPVKKIQKWCTCTETKYNWRNEHNPGLP